MQCRVGLKSMQPWRHIISWALLLSALQKGQATDYFVDPSGTGGAFINIQSAVDAVTGQTTTNRANIFIAPATYVEQVTVDKPYVTFIGQGTAPSAVKISYDGRPTTSLGATVTISNNATAFMARKVTFENSTPDTNVTQALAIESRADQSIFDNVRFLGYQDTLLADGMARQYFRKSFITGDTDFIYGNATAVFDRCVVESTDWGFITASSTAPTTANGLIFLDCTLIRGSDRNPGDDGTTAPNDSVFLGRPWLSAVELRRPSVIFIRTRMGAQIKSAGWDPWNSIFDPGQNRDPLTRLSEWGSMNLAGQLLPDSNGDGTPNGRVSWTDPMTTQQAANYTLQNIFGPVEFWNATTQPETSGVPYVSQGPPWDPNSQLLSMPPRPGAQPQMFNISTRLSVGTGENVGIGGFVISGTGAKKVIIRAIGESLSGAGLVSVLEDPILDLVGSAGELLMTNDNWADDPDSASELTDIGLAPTGELESAIVADLLPGQYTAIVRGYGGSTGTSLIEVYDGDPAAYSQFADISTRGFVEIDDNVLIGGFIVAGNGQGNGRVVVRAIGPSLSEFGITGPLENPVLELKDASGATIFSNDNWRDSQEAEIIQTGLAPQDNRESALVTELPNGNYTAIVTGTANTTGVALVEVYLIP